MKLNTQHQTFNIQHPTNRPYRFGVGWLLFIIGLLCTTVSATEPVACIQVKPDRLVMAATPGCYYEQPIAPGFIRQRDGKTVLHIDLPGRNFMPLELAAPGADAAKLVGSNVVQTVSGCPAGDFALLLEPNVHWQTPPVPIKHSYTIASRSGLIFSAYVRAATDNTEAPVTLGFRWQPAADKKEAPLPYGEVIEQTTVVGREWKRIAVNYEHNQEKIDGYARVEVSSSAAIEIGGLQLEPWRDYPAYLEEPTAWMPGETWRRNPAPATLSALRIPMDWKQGAVSLRVCVPEVFDESVSGERTLLFVGRFWGGILELGTLRSHIGKNTFDTRVLQNLLADAREHLLVLTWNDSEVRLYADSELLVESKLKTPPRFTESTMNYRVWIGTHNPRRRTVGGDIHDLRFYDRYLAEDEVTMLKDAPLPDFVKGLSIEPPLRNVFSRDEKQVSLLLPVHGKVKPGTVARLEGMPNADAVLKKDSSGEHFLEMTFQPWLCSAGERSCSIVLEQPGLPELRVPWSLHIVPAQPRDRYTVGNWGGAGTTNSLNWAKRLGLGLVDSRNTSPEYLNNVGRMGLRASVNFRNIQSSPHPATDEHLESLEMQAARLAKTVANFPWVTTCVHNSEGQGNDDVTASSSAMASLKTELGLDEPLFEPKTGWSDLAIRPKVDLRQFAESGIVPDDFLPLRYVQWLLREGDGMNTASFVTADALHAVRPDLRMVQEPARIYYATWADSLCSWRYANSPAPMLATLRQGLGVARSLGKPYIPLTGHEYYSPQMFLNSDGKKERIPPSGDMAAAFLWTGLAMPADEVRCFGFWSKNWDLQEKLRPGSHKRISAAIREIQRIGPIVGDVPHTPAALAILVPEANVLGRASEEWWHAIRTRLYKMGSIFDENDLGVDHLYEEGVERGLLQQYDMLYIPALSYISASLYREVQAWRQKGGQLILDTIANPAFEADGRVDFMLKASPWVDEARCKDWVHAFRKKLNPYVRLEEGRAIVFSKVCPDTHFVFVVNNAWVETKFSTNLTALAGGSDIVDVDQELKEAGDQKTLLSSRLFDIGVPQDVTISLREKEDVAIYDLRNGRRIMPKRTNSGRLQVSLPLLPGSAAVLAVYQRKPADLDLSAPNRLQRGGVGFVDVNLRGSEGSNLNGRHGIDLVVTKPDGSVFDASAIYCTEAGHTRIPLRLPLDAPVGDWKITARHLASGLTDEIIISVE